MRARVQAACDGGLEALSGVALVRVPRALSPSACAEFVRGVYLGRDHWTAAFDGDQFSLGNAWYTHLEEDKESHYFATARASDAAVERFCPGIATLMRGFLGAFVGAPVVQRPSFAGPGIHVFPAEGHCALRGGAVHFDTEGLTAADLRARVPAVTAVLMLQPARQGGALRVWDVVYEGEEHDDRAPEGRPFVDADYGVGELVVIDSYRLHQIQPFSGSRDRISVTCHAAFSRNTWHTWF